jgi:hypothetical protein
MIAMMSDVCFFFKKSGYMIINFARALQSFICLIRQDDALQARMHFDFRNVLFTSYKEKCSNKTRRDDHCYFTSNHINE